MQVSSPSVSIAKVTTTLSQRRVLGGPAPVTVPAGTFSCYAVESQREMATAARVDLVLKSGGREINYYSPAVGIVKTEYFDKNNKLLQTQVLSKRYARRREIFVPGCRCPTWRTLPINNLNFKYLRIFYATR